MPGNEEELLSRKKSSVVDWVLFKPFNLDRQRGFWSEILNKIALEYL
jgi:hypothetical protein